MSSSDWRYSSESVNTCRASLRRGRRTVEVGGEAQVGAQGVIYGLVRVAAGGDDVVQL